MFCFSAMSKSQSVILREKGNAVFCSASQDGVGRSLKASRLKDALNIYTQAKSCSCNDVERSSAAKNIGTAASKLVDLMIEREEREEDVKFYFCEALANFDEAFQLSGCKNEAWGDNLYAKFHELVQDIISYYSENSTADFNERMSELESFIPLISNAKHLRCELCIEIAQLRFNEGVSCLGRRDFKTCLRQIKECHRPVEVNKLGWVV